MANPNPSVWGTSDNWIYSDLSNGIQSAAAIENGFCKPFIAEFDSSATTGYKGSLLQGINVANKITVNQPLDRSICPCGQSPDVSPWGKIAIFNENNDISTTPSRIITNDSNINWFFCDRVGIGNNSRYYSKVYNHNNELGLAYQQFAPYAFTPASSLNSSMRISPYVYYGTRSFVLAIQVHLAPKNASEVIIDTIWTNLDNWVTYKDTHDLIGLRLFARNCMSYNNITNELTFSNDNSQTGGYNSNQIAVIQNIVVNNNGSNTNTEFFTLNMQSGTSLRSGYIFDIMDVQNYPVNDYRRTNGVLPCWNYFDGQQVKRWKSSDNYDATFWYTIPYSQANYDKIMQIASLFGCYFTPSNKYTFDYDMLDEDLYLTVLDENGVAHGLYTNGSNNANNSLYDKSSIRNIDYDPDVPPTPVDPNTYSNTTGFNSLSSSAAMTRRYVLNAANVEKLGDDLWTICNDLATGGDFEYFDGKLKDEFLTTNPIDSIVSLQRFPFSVPHTFAPTKTAVRLGKTDGSAQGYLTNNPFNTIVFKGIDIFARFGNCFLDYELTSYELYVPFCGTTKIRAADILGHKLNLTLQIDLMTGNCTAYIMADQLVIETLNGSCGVDMQLSGIQSATVAANLYNGILGQQQAKTNMIAQGASALLPSSWVNPVGYAAKGEQAETTYKQATYAIEHTETPVHSIGSASALLAWVQEFDARLIIYYPEGDVISPTTPPSFNYSALQAFGHLKGFATVNPGKVRDFQMQGKAAFLQGDLIAENIPCTQSERNKIKAFFAEGVYLPPIS